MNVLLDLSLAMNVLLEIIWEFSAGKIFSFVHSVFEMLGYFSPISSLIS